MQAALLGLLFGILVLAPGSRAATLPTGFQETTVFTGLNHPTVIQFASDGRVFVAEKSGVIKVFDNLQDTTPTVFADLSANVHDFWDRGLLGMALDPSFPTTPYVYVLYAWDYHPATLYGWNTSGSTQWGDTCPTPPGATADGCLIGGRLSRLQANGNVMTGSEQALIEDWCQQFPSHSTGSLAFGADGALYVSGGDGASFNNVDYGQYGNQSSGDQRNPCGDPPGGVGGTMTAPTAEGGALRSQSVRRPSGEPVSLDGAILRVDPATGLGLPDNPFAGSSDVNARRIVAYGLRNPFRMTIRPGTSEPWAADVGWNTWEEINRVSDPLGAAENFGWPCYEGGGSWGGGRQSGYDGANLNLCESLYNTGDTNVVTPYYAYNHSAKVSTENCATGSSSTAGLAFYTLPAGSPTPYPASYKDALFFSDYSRDCIWVMFKGQNGLPDPATRVPFVDGAANPVDLRIGPDGKLYYADFDNGRIQRIEYTGTNQPPVAVASANPTSGPAPLTVAFTGSGSSDPEGGPLTYAWDLDGDGQFDDSTAANPSYTYQQIGTYTAALRVTDNQGASSTSSPITINASNSPPVPTITAPAAGTTWKVGDVISFAGGATDQQEGTLPASKLAWTLVMEHCPSNCHEHTIQTWTGVASGSFAAPDHEYPSYLQLRLTATDSNGASATTTLDLQPRTVDLRFDSTPTGLQLTVGSTSQATPFTRTVIEGSANSVSANSPQTLNGSQYSFSSWSDGGAQSHTIVANAAASYTASYVIASADLMMTKTVASGGTTWTLRVDNLGPNSAVNVVVTDTLPSRLVFVAAPGCTYASATRVLTCAIVSLSAGASQTFTLSTTVSGKGGGWITNTAQVTSATADPNTANNSSTAKVRK